MDVKHNQISIKTKKTNNNYNTSWYRFQIQIENLGFDDYAVKKTQKE